MDRIFTPWRYQYVAGGGEKKGNEAAPACVFCALLEAAAGDESNYILHRARFNFLVLNLYPYTTGHLMIVPYAHVGDLDALPKEASDEMMDLAKRAQTALREAYRPEGLNLGMNLGRSAGAGVADHVHLHVLPRWIGDVNFMTAVGETRVLPEDLMTTYEKLRGKF